MRNSGNTLNVNLISKLKNWDGTHIGYLTELYNQNIQNPEFLKDIVSICISQPDLQVAATWLIKHHCDKGGTLPDLLIKKLFSVCGHVEPWEVKLHLLQILPHCKLSGRSIKLVHDFVRSCLKDKNKFVKTWAYNGLYKLIKYFPGFEKEVLIICESAMETESAAIKARVKKIIKALNKERKK